MLLVLTLPPMTRVVHQSSAPPLNCHQLPSHCYIGGNPALNTLTIGLLTNFKFSVYDEKGKIYKNHNCHKRLLDHEKYLAANKYSR